MTTEPAGASPVECRRVRPMKPSQAAIDWAAKMRFSALASNETIIESYEAHKRLLVKIAARKKLPNAELSRRTRSDRIAC
jgi:hypothetical protein